MNANARKMAKDDKGGATVKDWLRRQARLCLDRAGRSRFVRAVVSRELEKLAGEPWSASIIQGFVEGPCGDAYGIGPKEKTDLVERFRRSAAEIATGTSPLVHVVLAREILSVPPDVQGDVVECGVWKGASSASLSCVCDLVKRRLWVCDSFEGLPSDGMRRHEGLHTGIYGYYKEGMFAGTLEEVRQNISRWGRLEVCDFVKGFFAESLVALKEPLVFAFLDVDLASSTRDCLRHIWPLLVENGAIYTDDAADLEVVGVFFDEPWWRETLACGAPGYVGSGCGLPLNPQYSSVGYTRKSGRFDPAKWRKAPFLHYPDDEATIT